MSQNWAMKQTTFTQRLSEAVVSFLEAADTLNELCNEFATDAYGTGGANALTDAAVQSYLPAATALIVAEAEGALAGSNAILATIASNRGYLELMRP
jgi:hypothetical protein